MHKDSFGIQRLLELMGSMDTIIAMRANPGQHVALRMLPEGEGVGLADFKALDRLILSKNLVQLMESIDELGPISLNPLSPDAPCHFTPEQPRVESASSAAMGFRNGLFLTSYDRQLEDELFIDHPGVARVNFSALGRAVRERDAVMTGFDERLREAPGETPVSVELLQDWLDLRNNLALAARVLGFMTNPPAIEGVDPDEFRRRPLEAAGFVEAELGPEEAPGDSEGAGAHVPAAYSRQFRRLCAFSVWNTECLSEPAREQRKGFLPTVERAPLIASLLKLEPGGHWGLRGRDCVRYPMVPVEDPGTWPSTSGRMCLSVELREGEGQAEAARRYLEAEFHAWLGPTVTLDEGLELAVAPTPVGTGLATALWRMLAQRSEWEIAVCPNCGSAFLRPTKGYRARKRLWCDNSCHALYIKRNGPGAWFAPFAGLVGNGCADECAAGAPR